SSGSGASLTSRLRYSSRFMGALARTLHPQWPLPQRRCHDFNGFCLSFEDVSMKTLVRPALLFALLGGTPTLAAAQDGCETVERTITCYRPEYRTRTVPRTVCKVVPREIQEPYH